MEILSMPGRPITEAGRNNEICWKQLWSLAALYASIIIGWIAYKNYQPRLLVQFQFTDFTFALMVGQGIILTITPLIAGRLGDRHRFAKGHRLPIISAGISFAAMVFMAVAFTLLSNPGEILRWLLPVLIVLWLVGMSIFTSPALSTMELFAPVDKLPRAMAVLTIVGNLVYSLEPLIVDIIDYLGAPITFMLGGTVVLLSGYGLKKTSLVLFKANENQEPASAVKSARSPHGFIFSLGLAMGLATTMLFYLFPSVLLDKLESLWEIDGNMMVAGILFITALISWPACEAVNRYGMLRMFWISVAIIICSSLGIFFGTSAGFVLACMALFAISFACLSISSLPLAIKCAAFHEKVFCVGIFFGAAALPEGIWEAWLAWAQG